MVKRSSRIAKRDEIANRLAAVEKALRASRAKKEADQAAAVRRSGPGKSGDASQNPHTEQEKQ
jgi:hypothetical protein